MSAALVFGSVMTVALVILLAGEARGKRRVVFAAKPIASLAFVLLGAWRCVPGDRHDAWLLAALILCLLGDLLLLVERAFLPGLLSFLLGHLAYAVAFSALLPVSSWPLVWLLPIAVASGLVLAWLWPHLRSMRFPVLAYVLVISVMVWGAAAVTTTGAGPRFTLGGAALFYVSDIFVARRRFVARGFVNRAWGLPAYYAGQFLLALTSGR
jgi:uncharacterized membrane protein YhhN